MMTFTSEAGSIEAGIGCSLASDPMLGPVYVASLHPGGAAALSGLVASGDELLKIDDMPVKEIEVCSLLMVLCKCLGMGRA